MKSVFAMLMFAGCAFASDQKSAPEAIFVNGKIYTGTSRTTTPTAIAISDGRVVAVGSNEAIRKLAKPSTRVVDLGGHFVMPGFNDAHAHLASGGFEKLNVNLT